MRNLSDEELILGYQKGDAPAMDELVRRYKNPLFHFALRLCLNTAEAQDITQEVFLRVHQYKDSYRPIGKFCTWIFSIAHNLHISRIRRKKWFAIWPRKHDAPDELVEFASPDPSPKDCAEDSEFCAVLRQNLQSLPFLQREALILREYEKMDYQEIAKILNKSLGTVKTLIHRARQNLKAKLLPYLEEYKEGYNG
ncbi:MAG: sigma-70 family RNA polymerase sigma factor [Candidatus Omnitrophica bacterium]|nr:sigma-70 family RNA polymerase sigma factor [Candidatus Omnitrophota bacterium]